MPRGNLETVFPRALILSANRTLLDQLQFRKVCTNRADIHDFKLTNLKRLF